MKYDLNRLRTAAGIIRICTVVLGIVATILLATAVSHVYNENTDGLQHVFDSMPFASVSQYT